MPDSGALRTLLTRARDARTSDDVTAVLTEVADYAARAAGMGFANRNPCPSLHSSLSRVSTCW